MTGLSTLMALSFYGSNKQVLNTRHINSQNTIPSSLIPVPQGTQPYPTFISFTGAVAQSQSNPQSTCVDPMAPVNCFYA